METPVTKAQGQEFAKIVEEINQLGRSLGPAVVDLRKMHNEQWESYSWGPEDYETRLYDSHMRQKALEDAVMNALLLCAQHPQGK